VHRGWQLRGAKLPKASCCHAGPSRPTERDGSAFPKLHKHKAGERGKAGEVAFDAYYGQVIFLTVVAKGKWSLAHDHSIRSNNLWKQTQAYNT